MAELNYLDASIRGLKFQKNKFQIPKKINTMQARLKARAGIGKFNPQRLNRNYIVQNKRRLIK